MTTTRHRFDKRGLAGADGAPPQYDQSTPLTEATMIPVERQLGYPLPKEYRAYLAASNGGAPTFPAVHPRLSTNLPPTRRFH